MSDAVEKLSGKLGIDTTDFKTALGAANRELRVLDSGFKASAASLGDWTQSATGLESRVKTLTSQMDIQRLKVAALKEEHARLVAANGENSRAAQDAEIKLNKETETLNKMDVELRDTSTALDEMKSGSDEAGESVEELGNDAATSEKKLFTFKNVLGGIGAAGKASVAGIVALGAAAVATVGLLAGLALNTASTAEKLADLSNQTGISATRLQEMQYAGEILGTSLETITGAQAKLIRSMASGADGTGEQAKAFATLGVSITDSNGNLRDSQAVFAETIDALGRIENPAERDALAMQLFGKSAQELNPLIKAGSAELAKLSDEAHKMGAVMSEEDVAAAAAFQDQLDGLKMGFQGVMAQIGLAFIPGLSGLANVAKGYLQELVGIVQGAGGDVDKMAEGMGALFGRIVTDLAKQAPKLLQVGLTLVKSVVKTILSALPTMLPAAIAIIKSLIEFLAQNLPMFIGAAVEILLTLVNAIVGNLPILLDAAIQAILMLVLGLTTAMPQLVPVIIQAVVLIVNTLIQNLPLLVAAAMMLIQALVDGLIAAAPGLGDSVPGIYEALGSALLVSIGIIAKIGWQIILALASALASAVPTAWTTASENFIANMIIQGALWVIAVSDQAKKIVNALTNGLKGAADIGKNFVKGIWNGIDANLNWILSNVMGFADSIVDAVKEALKMQSPSKVGVDIGSNFISSIGLGGARVLPDITRAFAGMSNQLALATAGAGNASVMPFQQTTSEYHAYYAPVTIVSNQQAAAGEDAAIGRRF